jgi:hypothetical protein
VSARGPRVARRALIALTATLRMLTLLGPLLAAGCGAPATTTGPATGPATEVAASTGAGWRWADADGGRLLLGWRPVGGALARNEDARLDVVLRQDGAALDGARLVVRGWMPEHAHGLVRVPLVTAEGGGAYRVDGLLLHMRGRWELLFDVSHDGRADTVRFDLEL